MRGIGRASAAVTILNALPLRIGAALGVAIEARAEVALGHPGSRPSPLAFDPPGCGTPLVHAAIVGASQAYVPASSSVSTVSLRSAIPPSKGLKSSSAVASCVVRAIAAASDRAPGPEEVARLVASVSRASGTSATGAFDDALAGLRPGIVVTDNNSDRLLAEFELPPQTEVVVWVPPGTHPPSPSVVSVLATERPAARRAADRAMEGEWAEAMEINSELVERVMGYSYGPLRAACRQHGAFASGTSGLGPAFAALAPRDRVAELLEAFPAGKGELLVTRPLGDGRTESR